MITVLALMALALGLARLAIFIALHLVRSDYNIVEHAVSDYAVGRTSRLSTAMTWISAAFWLALAGTVLLAFPTWSDAVGIVSCLVILAAIFIALPFLPADLEGEPATTRGRLHLVAAVAWFAVSYGCMGNFVRLLQSTAPEPMGASLVVLSWVALISLIALVAALVIRSARRYVFGIAERIFILSVTCFYISVAAGILAVA